MSLTAPNARQGRISIVVGIEEREVEEPFTEEERFRIEDMLAVMAEAMTKSRTDTDRLAHPGELGRRLGMLTSYDVLRRYCEKFVDALARASARAGAEYPDLGQAVRMTRQGAQNSRSVNR